MRELSFIGKARSLLVESVHLVPCNWSAWLDIAALCPDRDVLRQLHVPTEHWIYRFFLGHVYLELQCTDDSLEIYHELSVNFPKNTYVLAQTAITHYNMQDFKESEQLFDMLNKWDPYRITNMDIYSNILYVTEKHAKLSYLAYKASSTDKFTPEANAIIGNYYSLKGDHVKAVIYFQRALALNPRYLSAWTLMGHEYLEMKNTNAAIPAYRKAVDINPRDYRAWYALGQSYELLCLPLYALYYYGKACSLRPYDARMWCAMAECYEEINTHEAIQCYKRAEFNEDKEGVALIRLAKIYHLSVRDFDKAAYYYKMNLSRREREGVEPDRDQIDALEFLAHHCKDLGQLTEAMEYCTRLLDFPSKQEEAKALLREINSALQSRQEEPIS
eukprot:TRINITY_DN3599_c0_g1_i37.p1 TRINITY_DN3599_c0_g1~~TRINITY_DN3599_c0_g1_i37.p1  ORF type:complete len:388 (+),score=57.35 TRINITY_DN3599_c0_g1_i37:513-1676(+)